MSEATPNLPVARSNVVRLERISLHDDDLAALKRAVKALEHTNLATRIANTVGRQFGTLSRFLPVGIATFVNQSAEKAIHSALSVALQSLGDKPPRDSRRFHKAVAALSGAAGGVFGLSSLPVELPVSTVIILRSIADIARNEGEDLSDPSVALACIQVFALGAHDKDDTFTDSGYFAVRGLLARAVSEASRYAVSYGLADQSAPVLLRLVSQIGTRFGIVVSEKLAAQAIPVLGAAGGAAVNYAFAEHFQSIAFGHFTVRRLERVYGGELVKTEYDRLVEAEKSAAFA